MRIEVIVPVRDAADLLPGCLSTILEQTLQPTRIHVCVAPSHDETADIAAAASTSEPRIVVHANAAGDRGSALNIAIAALERETEGVAMVDAQSRLAPDYLATAAAVLGATDVAVAGGPMRPIGDTWIQRGIAAALSSPAGVGDSSFHFGGVARDVDSVYLGVYRRAVLDAVGPYDPSLLRTEDDDMNARIRAAGGRIRLDPSIRSTYMPRRTLRALFGQYLGYGEWKVALAAVRPGAIRLRHLVPAALVAAFVIASVASVLWWPPALPGLALAYAVALLTVAATTSGLESASRIGMAGALAAMHWGYGLGSWKAIALGRWRR
jgi:glycosyltransferase involved in cell wall biosynthesis